LKEIWCYDNQLTESPKLPDNLEILYCYNNQIYDFIQTYFNKNNNIIMNINEYREWKINYQKIFVLKIEYWFLECKGNPKYSYCRKVVNTMYDKDYPE
jgi:hypothetical protein